MTPLSRPKRKFPVYVFESMFLSRTPKLGVEVLTVFAVVMCADAFAQQQTVLTSVTLTDGTGKPAQRNRTVVIEGDRIQSIAAGHEHTQLSAKVIDLQGQTIMPLITNTHGHLGLTKGTTESAANQTAAGRNSPCLPVLISGANMVPLQARAITCILKEDCSCVVSTFSACAASKIGAAHSIIVLNGIACVHGITLRPSWVERFGISDRASESLHPGSTHKMVILRIENHHRPLLFAS